jgi:hypothetical protein
MSTAAIRRAPYAVKAVHKRCGKCGKLVSRSAFQCRRCGKRQRMRGRTVMLMVSGCLMAAMFAAAALGGGSPSGFSIEASNASMAKTRPGGRALAAANSQSVPAQAPVTVSDQAEVTRVTAAELWLEYTHDPAAADRRLRGRPIIVSGVVRAIGQDFDGRQVVRFSTADPLETVNAKLADRDAATGRELAKSRPASLRCVGRGILIGAPLLESCSVL